MKNKKGRRAPAARAAALLTTAALALTPAVAFAQATAAAAQTGPKTLPQILKDAEDEAVKAAASKRAELTAVSNFVDGIRDGVKSEIDKLLAKNDYDSAIRAAELSQALKKYEDQRDTLEVELAAADAKAAAAKRERDAADRLLKVSKGQHEPQTRLAEASAPVSMPEPAVPALAPPTQTALAAGGESRELNFRCSLADPFNVDAFSRQDCLTRGPATGTVTIGDRPLQRRGLSSQLTSTGSASAVTIRYGDTFALSGPRAQPSESITSNSWKTAAWGWNVGIATSTAKGSETAFLTRLAEDSKERRLFESDRLDERAKLLFGLSYNSYRAQSYAEFQEGVRSVIAAAKRACEAEKKANGQASTTCNESNLWDWTEENTGFREALNDLYWGSPKAKPIWGGGLQFELAYPRFNYFDLDLAQIATDSQVPAAFLADKATSERKLQATALGYLFWTHGEQSSFVPSFTYKRAWAVPEAAKGISVCTRDPAAPVFKNTCRDLNIAAPVLQDSYFVGLEWRHLREGGGIFPALGIAPRYTFELDRGRHSFDMPIWLALDEKQSALNAGIRVIAEAGGETIAGDKRKAELGLAFFLGTNFDLTGAPK